MTEWAYNDPSIDDKDTLYRRVPRNPDCRVWDPVEGVYRVNAGGLRRNAGEGMSTHLDSILGSRGRRPDTLYSGTCGSVRFLVEVPRRVNAGVLLTAAPDEPDEDLAAAHAEVRPPFIERDRVHWRNVVNEIAHAAEWVQSPD